MSDFLFGACAASSHAPIKSIGCHLPSLTKIEVSRLCLFERNSPTRAPIEGYVTC